MVFHLKKSGKLKSYKQINADDDGTDGSHNNGKIRSVQFSFPNLQLVYYYYVIVISTSYYVIVNRTTM